MTTTAIVFPGQGSQKLGMLNDHYARFNEIKETYDEANDALGFNLWQITQEDEVKLKLEADLRQLKIDYGYEVSDHEEDSKVKSRHITLDENNGD